MVDWVVSNKNWMLYINNFKLNQLLINNNMNKDKDF